MDSSSARLLQNYSRTKTSILKLKPLPVIKTGKIVVRKNVLGSAPLPFMTLGFTDLLVVEYEMSYDDEESNVPTEEITLAFNSCTLHYAPQVEHGGLDHSHEAVGWDFKTNNRRRAGRTADGPARPRRAEVAMKGSELFKAGKLAEAIQAQVQEVKGNAAIRAALFLFELFCFAGEFDRARKQIDALQGDDPRGAVGPALVPAPGRERAHRLKRFRTRPTPTSWASRRTTSHSA